MKKMAISWNQKIEQEFIESQENLREMRGGSILLDALRSKFPQANVFCLLDWIPEQGEDIFKILVSTKTVAIFEMPRDSEQTSDQVLFQEIGVRDYMKKLSSRSRRRLMVAINLLAKSSA